MIPGVPFDLWIWRESLPQAGKVSVMRRSPSDLAKQRVNVIRRALDGNSVKLLHYKSKGYVTVLLLESNDIALASRDNVLEAANKAYRSEADEAVYDQIFIAMTATKPWCIVPYKIGDQLWEAAEPYWPTAPGYPLGLKGHQ
jgi:hypothetical protein